MQGDVIIAADSATCLVDSVVAVTNEHAVPFTGIAGGLSDSAYFYSNQFEISDSAVCNLMPVIVAPVRHEGVAHNSNVLSDSILFFLLLLAFYLFFRIIKNGLQVLPAFFRNGNKTDEHLVEKAARVSFFPYFWLMNLAVFSFTVMIFYRYFGNGSGHSYDNSLFWKVLVFIAAFWLIKYLLYKLIGAVFFERSQTSKWITGNNMLQTFFSFSMMPLLALSETGTILPQYILIGWPVVFFLIPKLTYCIKSATIFSAQKGVFFHFILYLCALEILPILLLVKGLFLLQ